MKDLILKKFEEYTKVLVEKPELTQDDVQILLVVLRYEEEKEASKKHDENFKNMMRAIYGESEVK